VTDFRPDLFSAPGVHGALVEKKHDGVRALWLGDRLTSREGAPLWATQAWWPALAKIANRDGVPMMLDGEWIEPGGFQATLRAFQRGAKVEASGRLVLFDAIPLAEWEADAGTMPLSARKRVLSAFGAGCPPFVTVEAGKRIWSPVEAQSAAEAIWARGGEGVVIKDASAPYIRSRGPAWLRIKRKLTVDAVVIEVVPAKDDPLRLATLVVNFEGRRVRLNCAALPLRERHAAMYDPGKLIGRVVEVEAMERTERGSLRQPRFGRWRDDKGKGEGI
jgi:ATP-dependent DNA ligase